PERRDPGWGRRPEPRSGRAIAERRSEHPSGERRRRPWPRSASGSMSGDVDLDRAADVGNVVAVGDPHEDAEGPAVADPHALRVVREPEAAVVGDPAGDV